MTQMEIRDHLRRRIIADLHLGRIKPGGRLPSLRTVAGELGVSIRAAARAYAELQTEGLVNVRGRSGIYLVLPQSGEIALEEPFDWYAQMLKEAWVRRLTINDVHKLLTQLIDEPLTVACVESTEDHMEAFCAELAADFSLRTVSVLLTADGARVGGTVMTLYDALSCADFVVTTAFHAAEVREAADLLKKPVVIASANDTLVDAFQGQLEIGPVTVVAKDPAFVTRFLSTLKQRFSEEQNLRVVHVDDVVSNPAMINGSTTLYTRAARKSLNEPEYHLMPPPIPFLSAAAARKVVQCMLSTHAKRTLHVA